jgi:hypothetical protein
MNQNNQEAPSYSLRDFFPLIAIFIVILLCTVLRSALSLRWDLATLMRDFMGFFFLIFGFFKFVHLKKFAEAYAEYDIIAKQFFGYGYLYPFLELGMGVAYLSNWNQALTNIFTLALMLMSAYGIFIELRNRRTIACACLGTVFKLPMTWVTLLEDLLMSLMALIMLFL